MYDADDICIQRTMFPNTNLYFVEAIGSFVNGTLHGVAKLVLEDETVIVADFVNGILKGN